MANKKTTTPSRKNQKAIVKAEIALPSPIEIKADVVKAIEEWKEGKPILELIKNDLNDMRYAVVRRVCGLDPDHGHRFGSSSKRVRPPELEKKLQAAGNRWLRQLLKNYLPGLTEREQTKMQTQF